jgi:hypothetical protein
MLLSSDSSSALLLPFSPTCALNGVPCPTPTWTPTWNLTQSTIIQPSSPSYFMPNHSWGLISLDWTVADSIWYQGDTQNTSCEATSITGCKMLKEAGLATRCFIYHNSELALQWLESQRVVMQDPSYQDFFLRYTDGKGNKIGEIYNEPIKYGNQYFWDYTNSSAAQYYITSILSTLTDPAVDGTFTDDVSGVPQEHPLVSFFKKYTRFNNLLTSCPQLYPPFIYIGSEKNQHDR